MNPGAAAFYAPCRRVRAKPVRSTGAQVCFGRSKIEAFGGRIAESNIQSVLLEERTFEPPGPFHDARAARSREASRRCTPSA